MEERRVPRGDDRGPDPGAEVQPRRVPPLIRRRREVRREKTSEAERRQRRFDGEVFGRRRVERRLREAVHEKRLREGALGERDAAGAFACEQLNQ